MNALRKTITVEKEPVVATTVLPARPVKLYVVAAKTPTEACAAAPKARDNALTNIALFLIAPFIGLAYIVALPFVGLGALAVLAARAAARNRAVRTAGVALKHGALLVGAPLFGLAYIIALPIAGMAALAWIGGRAAVGRVGRNLR